VVLVTLKAQALPGAAAAIERLLANDGVAVFAVNGIPWWWNKGTSNAQEHLECVDPGGELWARLKDRSLGCVIYSPNEVLEPGVIKTAMGDRWVFGEPDNAPSFRVDRLVQAFQAAKINGVAATDLRYDIWHKLLINCGLNPVAALTRLPTAKMTASPEVRAERCKVMLEVLEVALACGTDLRGKVDLEELVAPKKRPGSTTASMLQDVLAGRSLEHEAILGQVVEFARQYNISVPRCELMLVLLRGLNQQLMDEAAART
jgi:2-dehydropantoate 2-reductase